MTDDAAVWTETQRSLNLPIFVYPVVGLKPNPISDLSLFENGMTQKIHCHPAFTAYLLLRLFQEGGRGFA